MYLMILVTQIEMTLLVVLTQLLMKLFGTILQQALLQIDRGVAYNYLENTWYTINLRKEQHGLVLMYMKTL